MTCPHRVATEYGVIPAPVKKTHKPFEYLFERQLRTGIPQVSFRNFKLFLIVLLYFWGSLKCCWDFGNFLCISLCIVILETG